MTKKATLLIPSLSEFENLEYLLPLINRKIVNEVIVINRDPDPQIQLLCEQNKVTYLQQVGRGYGDAIRYGLEHASGQIVSMIDADCSYELSDLYKFITLLSEDSVEFDFILGSRYMPGGGSDDDTVIRFIGNKVITLFFRIITGIKLSDSLFLYIAAKREVFRGINLEDSGFALCIEVPIKAVAQGFKFIEIPSHEHARKFGKTRVNAFFDGYKIISAIIKYTIKSKIKP